MDAVLAGRAAALAARLADLTGGATRIEEINRGVLVLCAIDAMGSEDAWVDVQDALDDADTWSVQGRGPGPEPRLLRAELHSADSGTG
ncbi:hypothetical protein VT50_0207625 [Streptomyces antioxidans]|uniref:Uncharacterized protein n=1 Tax=Streptomyces antioxidans TaxID=1507734 RepID=A0A1V4DAD4_9ACTN|nr:hypothetical protein [Streptomyces antioxidans]OPF82396.1 hypothetical protein VT50_0207625 [Streptomyces antioxidans]